MTGVGGEAEGHLRTDEVIPYRVHAFPVDGGGGVLYGWTACRLEALGDEFADKDGRPMYVEAECYRGIRVGYDAALREAKLVAAVRGWSTWSGDRVEDIVREEQRACRE